MSADTWYLDTSAFLKLVRQETDSDALRRFLDRDDRPVVSSDLLRTEAVRAARRQGPATLAHTRQLLRRLTLIRCDVPVFEAAGDVGPEILRSLDAIHLAASRALDDDLAGIVTYDTRLAAACRANQVAVATPA